MRRTDVRTGVVADHLGVATGAASTLLHLYDAAGQPVSAFELASRQRCAPKSISVRISILRSILDTEAIDTLPRAYALTPDGLLEVRAMLNAAATALLVTPGSAAIAPQVLAA